MASLRQLTIKITGESSGLERAIAQAQKSAQGLAEKLTSAGSVLTQAVTLPIGLLGGAALKAAAEMEALTNGLRAVTKEAGPLQSQLDRLKRVAELPGLGFKEAVQGSINLQAAGFSAKTAERALSAFGNALATVGKGRTDLNGVVLALTQIQAKGKVSAEEINQLQERLPQIRKALVDAFGTAEGTELAKKGLGTNEVINRLIAEFEKLPQVTGGLGNSFENLKDKAEQSLAKIGQAISPFAIKAIDALEPIIGVVGRIGEGFAALPGPVQTGVVAIAGIAAAAGPIALIISKLAELRVVILSLGATSIGSAVLGPLLELGRAIPVVLSGSGTLALSFGAVATAAVGAGIATAFFLSKLSDPNRGLDEKAKGLANLQNKLNDLKPISKSTLASFEQFGEITARVFGDIQKKAEALNLDKAFSGLGIKSTVELQKALKDAQDFAEQIRKGVEAGTASQLDYARALEVVHARQNELNGTVDLGNKFFRAIPFNEKSKEAEIFNIRMAGITGEAKKLREELQKLATLEEPDFVWAFETPPEIQSLDTGVASLKKTLLEIAQANEAAAATWLRQNGGLSEFIANIQRAKDAAADADKLSFFENRNNAKDALKSPFVTSVFSGIKDRRKDIAKVELELRRLKDGAIREVASGFVDAISSAKSFGEAMRDVASSVSRNILQFVIERGIKLLIGQLGNLLDSLGSVGSAFAKIFGTASSVATTAGNAAGGISGAASSAATGIAGGAITGIVGAVSGVVTAVSSVIGLFQTARIEKDVGRIEVTTRGILNESLNLRAAAQLQYDGTFLRLGDIWNTLKEIRDTRGNAGFGSGQSITVGTMVVNAGATSSPREAAQAIIREFKLMGARA